jgi:hypothetical protein
MKTEDVKGLIGSLKQMDEALAARDDQQRKSNGQFGSGGGSAKKTVAKSSSEKQAPAPVPYGEKGGTEMTARTKQGIQVKIRQQGNSTYVNYQGMNFEWRPGTENKQIRGDIRPVVEERIAQEKARKAAESK